MPATVVRCEALTKYYGKSRGIEDLSLQVRPGEVYGFLGPNGAGKTTTIRCLLSMLRPTSGKAYLFDREVSLDGAELRRRIGYVAGEVKLLERQTGRWMLDYANGLRGSKGPSEKDLCDRLGFDPTRRIHDLSKGNKQKLALVIALMHDPELLILDEPTGGLDPLNQQTVFDIIEERVAQGTSVFLSSHILSEVERVCQRVAMVREGSVVAEESVETLLGKATRTIEVVYHQEPESSFMESFTGVRSVEHMGDTGLRIKVSEDIDSVVRRVLEKPVKDIVIEHASLEEIFLHLYGAAASPSQEEGGRP